MCLHVYSMYMYMFASPVHFISPPPNLKSCHRDCNLQTSVEFLARLAELVTIGHTTTQLLYKSSDLGHIVHVMHLVLCIDRQLQL